MLIESVVSDYSDAVRRAVVSETLSGAFGPTVSYSQAVLGMNLLAS